MTAADTARGAFEAAFGGVPDGVAFAPGRVNLIGDHVDYNDGLVLPMPLALGTAVAWRNVRQGDIIVRAADYRGPIYRFRPGDPPPVQSGWHSLAHGMVSLLLSDQAASAGGLELAISGDLPRGAGLSSSASLCIAIGRALVASRLAADRPLEEQALLAQQVEHRFAGVACGIMDQMVIAAGKPGTAMLLDCRTLERSLLALPPGWSVTVFQSGVERELVEGAYNARRSQCESAARKLGLASLRDADPETVDLAALDPDEARRARHVIMEIERTRRAADAIAGEDIATLGKLLREAHISMRDDFEASHPEVDRQVDLLNAVIGSAGGARMTGGGFGGAIVAICETAHRDRIVEQFASASGRQGPEGRVLRAFN